MRCAFVDVLGLDPHLHALGLDNGVRGADLFLVERDREGAQGDEVLVVAKLPLELLDAGAPDAQLFFGGEQVLDLALARLDDLQEPLLHGAGGAEPALQVGVLLGDVLAADPQALELALLAELLAEIEHKGIEMLGRHADGDRAADLAIGQLLAVDRGDEAPLDVVHEPGDGGDRRVEGLDLELDIARADYNLPRGRGGGASSHWVSIRPSLHLKSIRTSSSSCPAVVAGFLRVSGAFFSPSELPGDCASRSPGLK